MDCFAALRRLTSLIGVVVVASAGFVSQPARALSTPVTVTNPADIAKAEGIQHPFQANAICDNSTSNGFATFCNGSFAVPANQRLVIEYVSVECGISPGEGLRRVIVDTVTTTLAEQEGIGSAGQHSLNIVDHVGVGNFVAIGQLVRFYADPGTTISVEAQETGKHAGLFLCTFDLIGQEIATP
jgi:hypothetical protein